MDIGLSTRFFLFFFFGGIAAKWQKGRIIYQGISIAGISQEFGLGKSTISDFKRHREAGRI